MLLLAGAPRFLTHLEDKQMMTLVEAFEGVDKKAGDVIIRQGDIGDNFYVVDQGKVEVYKKSGDGPDVKASERQHMTHSLTHSFTNQAVRAEAQG